MRNLSQQEIFGTIPVQSYECATKLYQMYQTPAPIYHLGGEVTAPIAKQSTAPVITLSPKQSDPIKQAKPNTTLNSNFVIIASAVVLTAVVAYYCYKNYKSKKEDRV